MREIPQIVPYDPLWASLFREEAERIRMALVGTSIDLHHIGSTAIPNILAKPIIDILVIASSLPWIDQNQNRMVLLGYQPKGEFGIPGRRYFRKDNDSGERTHHVHIYARGSDQIERHIAFRDFLIAHPDWAEKYSNLKRSLILNAVANYTDAKTEFVQCIVQLAREDKSVS